MKNTLQSGLEKTKEWFVSDIVRSVLCVIAVLFVLATIGHHGISGLFSFLKVGFYRLFGGK